MQVLQSEYHLVGGPELENAAAHSNTKGITRMAFSKTKEIAVFVSDELMNDPKLLIADNCKVFKLIKTRPVSLQ